MKEIMKEIFHILNDCNARVWKSQRIGDILLRGKIFRKMTGRTRKNETFFKYLIWISHFWLGLLSSIVVFVVCFTGCLYAFKNQITEIYNRDKVFVEKVSNAKKFSADDVQNQFLKNHKKMVKNLLL